MIIVTIVLLVINIFAFGVVGVDKRKSVQGSDRYSEVSLFLWAVVFGSLGIFAGMFFFRHKTRKAYFPLGIGLLLIQQIFLFYLLYKNFLTK